MRYIKHRVMALQKGQRSQIIKTEKKMHLDHWSPVPSCPFCHFSSRTGSPCGKTALETYASGSRSLVGRRSAGIARDRSRSETQLKMWKQIEGRMM